MAQKKTIQLTISAKSQVSVTVYNKQHVALGSGIGYVVGKNQVLVNPSLLNGASTVSVRFSNGNTQQALGLIDQIANYGVTIIGVNTGANPPVVLKPNTHFMVNGQQVYSDAVIALKNAIVKRGMKPIAWDTMPSLQLSDLCKKRQKQDITGKLNGLIRSGANINYRDRIGRSPLMNAAVVQPANIVQAIINYGANVNAVDSQGNSALHLSTLISKIDIVKILIARGEQRLLCLLRQKETIFSSNF
jgi:hypothetical protein